MSDIQYGDKWEKDKLKRKDDADYLSSYLISKHEKTKNNLKNGSFVLNVNAEWGFGKTYLLKNWADDLANQNHPVVYFDAWKNDFSRDPLLAFISTINEQLSPYFDKKVGEKRGTKVKHFFNEWYKSGKKLVSPSSPILLAVIAKKMAGMSIDELNELLDDENEVEESDGVSSDTEKEVKNTVSSVVSKTATKMMETHSSTKKTINDFKLNLGKLTNHLDSLETINLPMFIFIDELDRCRPNYAIEVLENIKHLFGVSGVFFIVATASEQLSHSVKAVYGQSFDSPNYLKRFFDQTYTLQDPDRQSFAEYLFQKYDLAERENLFSPFDKSNCLTKNPEVEVFSLLSSLFNCSLRDMIQYCVVIDSVSLTTESENIHIFYLLFLILLKDKNNDSFESIVNGNIPDLTTLSINDIVNRNGIKTISTTASHLGNSRETVPLTTILQRYIHLSKMSNNAVSHYTADTYLVEKIIRELTKTPLMHDLSQYPQLLEQAGKFE